MRDQIAKLAEAQNTLSELCSGEVETEKEEVDNLVAHIRKQSGLLCFREILAEFDRLSKIEAAAREVRKSYDADLDFRGSTEARLARRKALAACIDALDAALNAKGQP